MAIEANGPYSGPTTMAPTIRIGESASTPTAPMSTAITSSATKLGDRPLSSRTGASTSSQMTASDGSPGTYASAAAAASNDAVSMRSMAIEPRRWISSRRSSASTPLATSRATSNWTRSPSSRRAAPATTTMLHTARSRSSTASTSPERSGGATTRTWSTVVAPPAAVRGGGDVPGGHRLVAAHAEDDGGGEHRHDDSERQVRVQVDPVGDTVEISRPTKMRMPPRAWLRKWNFSLAPASAAPAGAEEKFPFLSHALGGILIFVGMKLTVTHWVHLNTYLSLAIIMAMLTAAIIFSVRRDKTMAAQDITPPAQNRRGNDQCSTCGSSPRRTAPATCSPVLDRDLAMCDIVVVPARPAGPTATWSFDVAGRPPTRSGRLRRLAIHRRGSIAANGSTPRSPTRRRRRGARTR